MSRRPQLKRKHQRQLPIRQPTPRLVRPVRAPKKLPTQYRRS
jgi:hypothetical protein